MLGQTCTILKRKNTHSEYISNYLLKSGGVTQVDIFKLSPLGRIAPLVSLISILKFHEEILGGKI